MTTLTDTQIAVLSAASSRPNRIALPLPERLKGGAAERVVGAMLKKGLLEEVEAERDEPVWRETDDGYGVTLVATHEGLEAIGVEPTTAPTAPETAPDAPQDGGEAPAEQKPAELETAPTGADTAPAATKPRKVREGTKQAALIAMLRAESGATIDEIVAATGWQSHAVRGAIAGALKKKLGLEVTSDKVDGRGRVYRLPR